MSVTYKKSQSSEVNQVNLVNKTFILSTKIFFTAILLCPSVCLLVMEFILTLCLDDGNEFIGTGHYSGLLLESKL